MRIRPTSGSFCPGGIIHAYQKYDPQRFPSPTSPPPDVVSGAFEHLLAYGSMRELTPEELARAVRIDPSQLGGLGPSLDALMAMLRERKRKILATYETQSVASQSERDFSERAASVRPPRAFRKMFQRAVQQQQLYDLERLWFRVHDDGSPFARQLVQVMETLGRKYEIEELAAKYAFTGRQRLTVNEALDVKAELEQIDALLKQLEEAREQGTIGLIDMEALEAFTEPGDLSQLSALQQQVQDYVREMAERQGLEERQGAYQLTPQAYRLFQGKLLERIFSDLLPSKTGRHAADTEGEGTVALASTKPYEFGDSLGDMDIPQSFINALVRQGNAQERREKGLPLRLAAQDIEVHRTRNAPKCATAVIMDMSGSMRYDGQYINVKRMALALEGLLRSEYPGDFLRMIEMYTFAKLQPPGRVVELMPKPVTIHDPWVRLKIDMSREDVSELAVHPHFTNIQHALQLARLQLASTDTPNRQVILITDGLPTAHFEGSELFLLYPPDPRTEQATLREAQLCRQEGITINLFLVPSWSQSQEDIRFAYRLAETTRGRVFFTAGKDLDRCVVWDYVHRKREILG